MLQHAPKAGRAEHSLLNAHMQMGTAVKDLPAIYMRRGLSVPTLFACRGNTCLNRWRGGIFSMAQLLLAGGA